MAHIRKCVLCGSEYDYCPRCDETKPTFYLKYCSDNCNNISLILNKFAFKHLTDKEAASELAKCDLSSLDKYSAKMQAYVTGILTVGKEPEEVVEVEQKIDASTDESPVEVETEVEVKPVPKYRKASPRRK